MNFLDFAAAHGLVIDHLVEGRWARVKTTDKTKKRNGAYKFLGDVGFVQNHATMQEVAVWRPDSKVERINRAEIRKMQRQSHEEELRRQESARATAEDMIARAQVTTHDYLTAKGFPTETGLVLDGELLIPMREFTLYKQVNSLQRIKADGSKLFLFGGKAKGSVYFIGPFMARERWLCEGYATGLSIRAALGKLYREAQVVVCFSAGNLAHVGRLVKALRPKAYVVADNDKSGAGEEAAIETGLPYWLSPTVGEDFNDYHVRVGVRAAAESLRDQMKEGERMAVG